MAHRPLRAHRVSRRLLRDLPTSIFHILTPNSYIQTNLFIFVHATILPPQVGQKPSDQNLFQKIYSKNPAPFRTAVARPRQLNKPKRLRTGRLMFARAARTAKRCNVSTRTLERHFRQRVNRRHRLPEWGRQLHNSIYLL